MNNVLIIFNGTSSFQICCNVFGSISYLRNEMRFRPADLGLVYEIFFMPIQLFNDMALLAWKCNDYPKIRGKICKQSLWCQSWAFHKLVVDKSCGWVNNTDMSHSRSSIKQNDFSPNWNYRLPGFSANNDGIYKMLAWIVLSLVYVAQQFMVLLKLKKRVLWHLVHVCVILNNSHNIQSQQH